MYNHFVPIRYTGEGRRKGGGAMGRRIVEIIVALIPAGFIFICWVGAATWFPRMDYSRSWIGTAIAMGLSVGVTLWYLAKRRN